MRMFGHIQMLAVCLNVVLRVFSLDIGRNGEILEICVVEERTGE